MKVKDCMCDDVCCAKPETTVSDVAKLMSKNHVGSIPKSSLPQRLLLD